MAVPTRSWPHTSGPIGCDHDERIVPVDLVASPDKLQRGLARLERSKASCRSDQSSGSSTDR
jgi:hypothetical protein